MKKTWWKRIIAAIDFQDLLILTAIVCLEIGLAKIWAPLAWLGGAGQAYFFSYLVVRREANEERRTQREAAGIPR